MNKRILIFGLIGIIVLATTIFLAINNKWFEKDSTQAPLLTTPCTEADVSIEGYGDKGKQLESCFVQYPGEPTRKDNSYYIVEDICGQFTEAFMENISGQSFVEISSPIIQYLYNCTYFTKTEDGITGDYILLQLEYLSIEDQKMGHESLGRSAIADSNISMTNYVIYEDSGVINCILLGLSENKYLRIDRSSTAISDEILLNTAIRLASEIEEYK